MTLSLADKKQVSEQSFLSPLYFLGLRPLFLPRMFFHENDVRLISIKRGGRVEGCTGRVVVCRRRCRRSGARKHNKLEAAPVRARGPPSERQLGQAGWQTEEEEGGRVITLRFSCSLSFPPLMFGIQKKSKGKRSFFSCRLDEGRLGSEIRSDNW